MTTLAGTGKAPVPAAAPGAPGVAQPGRLRRLWGALGPGLVTGASDDDPSGIATYAQAGAQFGFGLLWTALVTLPLMMAIQEICDRTALATGKTLGELVRVRFTRQARACIGVLIVALVVANTLNIAADLEAIGSGMALLHAGPVDRHENVSGNDTTMSGTRRVLLRDTKPVSKGRYWPYDHASRRCR